MKKRLSLLMVLMMVVSLLPMSAFAAATPGYTTLSVNDDEVRTVSVGYVFQAGQTVSSGQVRFELDNGATFVSGETIDGVVYPAIGNGNVATAGGVSATGVQLINDNILVVNVSHDGSTIGSGTDQLTLNVPVEFSNTGDVNLRLVDNQDVGFGTQSVKIAVVGTKDSSKLAVSVTDDEKAISFDGGKLSQFEIKNIPAGTKVLTLEVEEGMKWIIGNADPTLNTTVVGLGGQATPGLSLNVKGNILTLTFTSLTTAAAERTGSLVIVPSFGGAARGVTEGNVVVDLEAYDRVLPDNDAKRLANNRATIGKVVDYNVTITVVEKNKKEIPAVWGGEEADVTVTLKGPKGSILDRAIEFTVDGADVLSSNQGNVVTVKPSASGVTITGTEDKDDTDIYKNAEFETTTIPALTGATEVKFDLTIKTSGSKDGVATITAAQRGWEVKADLAKITPKFAITADVTPIKKGEARDAATVTITEAKAGLLERGERLVLTFDTRRDYTQFTSKGIKVEATNGMTFDTASSAIKWVKGNDGRDVGLSIPITRSSAGEAAVITITGLNVAVDGSATDDVVKLDARLASRAALQASDTVKGTKVASADYVKVVKEYALESILSVFTIGQTTYTVNGEEKSAASAPYIKDGRTMLPIRAVAESLGLDVQWNSATKTASFTDDNKVAAVTIGAKVLYVNGTPMPLTVAAELVNDTTFVELRSLATAFGVQIDWDAAAKTATVSK